MTKDAVVSVLLFDAVVALENAPCPLTCSEWDEDGCDCGRADALSILYGIVGADADSLPRGQVPDGHPLQTSRLEAHERWKAANR